VKLDVDAFVFWSVLVIAGAVIGLNGGLWP
jgi:hypothetical protein